MKKIFINIILTFLFFVPSVKALNSTIESMGDVYHNSIIDGHYNSDIQGYLNIEGNLVYCLEPEKKFYGIQNYKQVDYVDLTQEQLYKVRLIGHYGYEYYDHQNYLYYLAAQELIWRITRPTIEMTWSTEIHGRNYSAIDVEKEKEEIQYLADNHLTKPHFDGTEIDIAYNDVISLEDDILKYYEVISNTESEVRIDNNKLIIHKNNLKEETIKLKKKIKYDDKEKALYSLDNYQSVILARANDEVVSTIKLKQIMGSVSVSVVDSKNYSLHGRNGFDLRDSQFSIYDELNNPVKTITLDGNIQETALKSGKYKLKQVRANNNYLLDDTIYNFEINEMNLKPSIIVKNELKKAKLTIEKSYGAEKLKEVGAIFEIIGDDLKEQVVTNENGLGITQLEYGNYSVKQIKGIQNHYLAHDFEIKVNSDLDLEYKIVNEEIKANLKVSNIDFEKKDIIKEKIIFKIFSIDKNSYIKNGIDNNFATTNGTFDASNLSYGSYYIEQINSPKGYLNNEKIYFNVPIDKEIIIENKPNYKNIKIIVEGENELLNNVEFSIYSKDDIELNGKMLFKKDQQVEIVKTKEGQALSKNIPIGIYYIKEIKTNEGYVLDDKIYEMDLNTDSIIIKNHKKTVIEDVKEIDDSKVGNIQEESSNKNNDTSNATKNDDVKVDKLVETDPLQYETVENINLDSIILEDYIRIPNTGINFKEKKLDIVGALLIILMGYIVLKYAKE